ncbi:hypothetical protein M408DRAFT_30721 [Serendipita vermifera MAFF 305830]|uniref:Uncharacterized protein n=1 Tax=Serendipita vermifera MAFF 305830 TaxID=933852 RepID=A0A0C3AIZ5_SERVB|nr:hypothetical protein M408DRAFT_30721 [Serendipita vermifera MAFF 305830]
MPRLKALRYQGQMHWVSEKLLSSVSQTVQHLEIKIAVQDLEYTVRCLGAASALRSLALSILALDSALQSMSRGPAHLPLSVANWKARMTRSSDSTIGHGGFKCRILDSTDDTQDQALWRAFHHACPRVISLLQKLSLGSVEIRLGILSQQDLDNRPANGILPVIPEEAWEAPVSEYPRNITEATIAEAIIIDIMNSAHLAGIGHSPDYTMYAMPRNPEGALRFHWGEPIPILWRAPLDHSRKAWIGIYPDGANPLEKTEAKSNGRWVPLHAEEWDGDIPLPEHPINDSEVAECGEVGFQGFTLPWETGSYELRYHKDGKYRMVSEIRRVEIYLEHPKQADGGSLRDWLLRVVCLALDSDPDLIPRSVQPTCNTIPPSQDLQMDDFRFWTNENGQPTMRQPNRIAYAIEEALEIRLPAEEILQHPNVSILTQRILSIMSAPRSPTSPRRRRSRSPSQDLMASQNIFR